MDHDIIINLKTTNSKICTNCHRKGQLYDIKFKHLVASFESGIRTREDVITEEDKKDQKEQAPKSPKFGADMEDEDIITK